MVFLRCTPFRARNLTPFSRQDNSSGGRWHFCNPDDIPSLVLEIALLLDAINSADVTLIIDAQGTKCRALDAGNMNVDSLRGRDMAKWGRDRLLRSDSFYFIIALCF